MDLKEELAILKELGETENLSVGRFIRKSQINKELQELYAEEELQWLQKSHERWLLYVDQNTGYFHRVASGLKIKKTPLNLYKREE